MTELQRGILLFGQLDAQQVDAEDISELPTI
jgi:hypothetical protein